MGSIKPSSQEIQTSFTPILFSAGHLVIHNDASSETKNNEKETICNAMAHQHQKSLALSTKVLAPKVPSMHHEVKINVPRKVHPTLPLREQWESVC
jgi:hypothetical protein